MTARVRGVSARAIASMSRSNVRGSTSTRTARAPAAMISGSYRKCGGRRITTSSPSSATVRMATANAAMAAFVRQMSEGSKGIPRRSRSDAAAAACASGVLSL